MLLSKKTVIPVTNIQSNYIGHMCCAAYKLWNVCNYERKNYTGDAESYPDWYNQKATHKDNMWYKSLPSQTAQEVLKLLQGSWKSFFVLLKTGGVENPHPPHFKHEGMPITYMQNGLVHTGDTVRLTISAGLKRFMFKEYQLNEKYIYLKNKAFEMADTIKQLKLYPPEAGMMNVIIVYEVPDYEMLPDNGHYLSIDQGLHNLLTCYDNLNGRVFITGREYLSICRRFDKEISRIQAQWAMQQTARGVQYPKPSQHVLFLYEKKRNCIHDYLHKMTHAIAVYCMENDIHTVIIGDITGIRKNKDLGDRLNQQLHGWPYKQIYDMLKYKLAMRGIRLIKQKEGYSSQCSPLSKSVSPQYADKQKRVERGLYREGAVCWNADAVGAYNILRLYLKKQDVGPINALSSPTVLKVAV